MLLAPFKQGDLLFLMRAIAAETVKVDTLA